MAILRAQAIIPYFTGVPRDVMSNTLHFDWDESGTFAAAATTIGLRMDEFYEDIYGDINIKAPYVAWNTALVEITNLDDPTPRIPEVRPIVSTVGTGTSNIPTEVAVVMTFAAAETGGVVRQRLYNRIYLGGLANGAFTAGSASLFPFVSVLLRSRIDNAATTLLGANDGVIDWIQYSPTDGTARPITRGWIDDGPDTQRRRSVDAATRTTWLP